MEGSASSDRHRRSSIVDRDRGLHQDARTAVMHRDIGNLSLDGRRSSQKLITIRSSSDGRQSMTKNCDRSPIVTRSRCDQSSIMPRLGPPLAWNRFNSIGRRATHDQDHDHGPIATRSWPDRGMIVVHLKPKLRLTYLKFGSYDAAAENRAHDPEKPLPRPPLLPTIFGPISLFKSMYSPSLFFNF